MPRVFIVEDDQVVAELVRLTLRAEGFEVAWAADARKALHMLQTSTPDLVILDWVLPGMSGIELCQKIRLDSALQHLPVIMLTVRGEESDRVIGLELGADDYLVKPFSTRELVARVKALLRRTGPSARQLAAVQFGNVVLASDSLRATRGGTRLPLSVLEFRLLYFLATHPNRVFTRDQLLNEVWGTNRFVTLRSVDVCIRQVREKVEPNPRKPTYIKTVRGAGYMFEPAGC